MTSAAPTGKVSDAVARVERELARIWSSPDEATGQARVRASMMSFVVVTTPADMERVAAATNELVETHPGRVFVLGVDPRLEPWDVRTETSALCRREGAQLVCSDRVDITFGVGAAARAASVVGALALPEVPTFLEAAPSAPPSLLEAALPLAERVIVDSAHLGWKAIADLAKKTPAPVADRNFVRSHSWRELVARFFDDATPAAHAIRRVEIGRTAGGRQEPAALLLGWLASRLGWSFESASRARDPFGAEVEIALATVERGDLGPGEVVHVKISATFGGKPLECTCARGAEPRDVTWTMRGAKTADRQYSLGFRDETWVLGKALDATASDAIYRELVSSAASYVALAP